MCVIVSSGTLSLQSFVWSLSGDHGLPFSQSINTKTAYIYICQSLYCHRRLSHTHTVQPHITRLPRKAAPQSGKAQAFKIIPRHLFRKPRIHVPLRYPKQLVPQCAHAANKRHTVHFHLLTSVGTHSCAHSRVHVHHTTPLRYLPVNTTRTSAYDLMFPLKALSAP